MTTKQPSHINIRPALLGPDIRARQGDNAPGWVVKRDLERYYAVLAETLQTVYLTEREALLICDALNGTLMEAHTIRLLWAEVDDAIRADGLDRSWNVDGSALVVKLRELTLAQTVSIVDAVERWHNLDPETSQQDRLRTVGLIR